MNEVKVSGTWSILGNRIWLAYGSMYGELMGLYRKIQEHSWTPSSYAHETERVPTSSIGRSDVRPVMAPHQQKSGLPLTIRRPCRL